MDLRQQPFGTVNGVPVNLYTLSNDNGLSAGITNYGGIIVSLLAPNRDGQLGDVVLGFDSLEDYLQKNPFFGCLVGRYANRIAGGSFTLNGVGYTLAQNNGPNHLHGGLKGFDKVIWQAETESSDNAASLRLHYLSRDGEEGYPGNLSVNVVYALSNDNALKIDYQATTDQATILNLTNHTYFNLAGRGDILGHVMTLNAEQFTPVDAALIPTGELRSARGTPMDFTRPIPIGDRINAPDEQVSLGRGYDHNWILNNPEGSLTLAARVTEPASGRVLEVLTTQPGVQFYTGNMLPDRLAGKQGQTYSKRSGFCLETQHFPDSPNQPDFPSVVLQPEDTYHQTTIFKFSVE
jgi:aldose 1-epimerase